MVEHLPGLPTLGVTAQRKNNQCWAPTTVQGKKEREFSLHLCVTTGFFPTSRLPKPTELMLETNLSEGEHVRSPTPRHGRRGVYAGPRESIAQRFNHLPSLEQLSCGNHFDVNLSAAFLSEINGA